MTSVQNRIEKYPDTLSSGSKWGRYISPPTLKHPSEASESHPCRPRRPHAPLDTRYYVLQDRDGDYVKAVRSTGFATALAYFEFTKDKEQARRFTYDELWNRSQTDPIGIQFTKGFGGGRAVALSRGAGEARRHRAGVFHGMLGSLSKNLRGQVPRPQFMGRL